MYYPTGGGAGDLAEADVSRVAKPHEYAHNKQSHAGNSHEDYLLGRMIKIDGKGEAGGVGKLNDGELPRLARVLHEHKSAQKIAEIEHSSAVCTNEDKIEEKHKSSRALKQKEGAVLFKLEGKDYNAQSHQSQRLCYNIYHIWHTVR